MKKLMILAALTAAYVQPTRTVNSAAKEVPSLLQALSVQEITPDALNSLAKQAQSTFKAQMDYINHV